jgi:hypothetical protein
MQKAVRLLIKEKMEVIALLLRQLEMMRLTYLELERIKLKKILLIYGLFQIIY